MNCNIPFLLTILALGLTVTRASATEPNSIDLVSFADAQVLSKITFSTGVTISRTDEGFLKVHVVPFEQHKNMWPVVAFDAKYFGQKINLADYSRLEAELESQCEGLSHVDFQLSTSPDATSGVDYEVALIPGYSPWTMRMDLTTLKNNDPSEVSVIQFIFRPRPGETDFLIKSIRAVYDPETGSSAEKLVGKATAAKQTFTALKDLTSKLPAEQQANAKQQLAALAGKIDKLSRQIAAAKAKQYAGAIRATNTLADEVINETGRLRFLADGPLLVWSPDRYVNVLPETGPDLQTQLLKDVSLSMAGNEFRDIVFSTTASGKDMSLNVAVQSTGGAAIPADAIDVRVAEYPKNSRGEMTGDVLVPVDGPVAIPAGESRQFWVRFNTRTATIPPGDYTFDITLNDDSAGVKQTLPGTLTVWNFALPGYDVLPNNSYAIFSGGMRGDATGEIFRQAVADMKAHGFNHVFIEPPEIPVPTGLDDNFQITGYSDAAFSARLKTAMDAWNAAPCDGTLNFIIALSSFEELGLKKEGYAFGNENWKKVLRQYVDHLNKLTSAAGVGKDQWMLVLRDESMEPILTGYDIPFAEAIKKIDPSIRIKCNSSAVMSDPGWTERYFKAFDLFQPHRGLEPALEYVKKSGRPIWWYECDTAVSALNRDLYHYYRLYSWYMLNQGIAGTGVWTYYSSPHDRPWGEDFQGCQLVFLHPRRGLVHSRRYEMFREGADDWRYVAALRAAAQSKGDEAMQKALMLITQAIQDVLANLQDRDRAETWRTRIAQQILYNVTP